MADGVRFSISAIDLFERDVKLRMLFRFGVVTLTESPQAFARVRIRLENGSEASGAAAEQAAFLAAHPDLYEHSFGAVRVRIKDGDLAIGSLACVGFASAAMPDWNSMSTMK